MLSIITGGGRWVEIKTHADPLYQHLIVTAERKFWRLKLASPQPCSGSIRRSRGSRPYGLSI